MKSVRRLAFLTAVLAAAPAAAEEIDIREAESILAVITHKGGFAASKAHNHLIAATGYRAELTLDPADPRRRSRG